MSYYGYVERKPEDIQVNWGEISQGILKSVQEWEQGREDLREKLDKETRETQKAIAETPETKNEPVQTWILNTATTASEKLADLNRQLKSNQIKPREYNLLRSNIMSDVTGVYAFAKAYDQGYAAKLQRIADGKASYVEKKSAEDMEDFIGTNLSSLTPVIDETGTLIYKKPDGASMSYRQIVKNSTIKRDDKNALEEVTKYAQSMKAHEVLQPDGSYKTSASLNEEAKRAIGSYVKQYLVDDNDVADILYDYGKRKGFEIKNGKAVVTEEDRKEAEQILLDAAYGTFGMQITPAPRESSGGGSGSGGGEKPTQHETKSYQFGVALRNLNDRGNQAFVAGAIDARSISYNGSTLTIVYKDGSVETPTLSPDKVAGFLMRVSGLDQSWAQRGLGGNVDVGAMNYAGAVKPVAKPNPLTMYNVEDENGKEIVLTKTDMYNEVAKLKKENPSHANVFRYRNDPPRIIFVLKDSSAPDGYREFSAKNIEQLNTLVQRFNKDYAK